MYKKSWYASTCDRKTADDVLVRSNKVRVSSFRRAQSPKLVACGLYPITPLKCECFLFQDGAFMVRKSSGQDSLQPYTLVVFYKGRVYNIPIRYIPTTQQYALGREKKGEEVQCRAFNFFSF